jgi:cytochrome b pre-mRNA-processing protein 3
MTLLRWFRSDPHEAAGQQLYLAAVEQARQPAFYAAGGVPDTIDGRFEMIALHVFLVLYRLKRGEAGLARALSEALFADMDRGLREMGAGDLGVGKRVQAMAQAFYGRVTAYEAGLGAAGESVLHQAVERNVYGTVAAGPEQVAAMARYLRDSVDVLHRLPDAAVAAGEIAWPALTVARPHPM